MCLYNIYVCVYICNQLLNDLTTAHVHVSSKSVAFLTFLTMKRMHELAKMTMTQYYLLFAKDYSFCETRSSRDD